MASVAKLKDKAREFERKEEWAKAVDAYLQVIQATEKGDGEVELSLYNRVGDLYLRLGKPSDSVDYYSKAADHYGEAGLYNNAIALCNKALRYQPDRVELYRKLGKLSAEQGFVTDARRWYLEYAEKLAKQGRKDEAFEALKEFASLAEDPEVREMLAAARAEIERIEQEIRLALVERDPNDDKNVIVEIRAGAGGDEASLWAADLFRMLTKYAERRGLTVELLETSEGAFTFAIKGDGAYSIFKFEGGTHRVQRVPATESQGRVHTSTATVAVLPEADDVDIEIDPNDLQIDVYRSSGPGGQSVNTTDSAVRITHKPSGIVVAMQDEKSQLQNRERAMRVLRARLYDQALAEQQAELAADRRSQVGTGERAEKIRTYNYGERRVKDHRINLLVHNLDEVLEGTLDEFTEALQADEKRRVLELQATA
jgi:peptide chain release factor 1